jgi:DNA-binding GntR family transcriptional regulator
MAEQVLYLLAAQFRDDLLETADFTRSVFAIYAEHGRFPARAEELIAARPASEAEAELLKMDDLPISSRWVYVRDRVTYDGNDRVLEVMRSVDRLDFFRSYRYAIQGAHLADPLANRDAEAQGNQDA